MTLRFLVFSVVLALSVVGLRPLGLLDRAETWVGAQAQLSFGGTIESIVIQGNQRFADSHILDQSGLATGQPFEAATLNTALRRLMAGGQVEDVQFARDGGQLIILVREPRFINRIFFDGNSALSDDQLISLISFSPADPFDAAQLQRDVQTILAAYSGQGRYQAAVNPYLNDRGEGRVDLVFLIEEGNVSRVGSVNFVGNASFSDRTLRGVVSSKQYNSLRTLTNADRFTEIALNSDRQALAGFYQDRGYIDVEVRAAQAAAAADQSGFVVTFIVSEGTRYRIGDIGLVSTIPGLEAERLGRVPELTSGRYYNASQVARVSERLRSRAEELGFGAAEVTVTLDRDAGAGVIDVTFRLTSGPAVQVERIEIEGNLRTRDYVIRREMRLAEGDAFSTNRLQRSIQRIRGLGYFSSADISTGPGSSDNQTVVRVQVQEQSTGSLNFGGGISSASGTSLNVSYEENNFYGRGQQVVALAQLGENQRDYNLLFREPWMFGREVSGGINLFASSVDSNTNQPYDLITQGVRLTSGYKLSERWRQSWSITNQTSEVTNITSTSALILDQAGRTQRTVLGTALNYNDLDSVLNPRSGILFNATFDAAGGGLGGDVDWQSATLDLDYFRPISDALTLRLSASAGQISAPNGTLVPLVDRFAMGQNLVRGFSPAGLGPRTVADGDPVGATRYYGTTMELQFPFPGLAETGLSGRVFIDAGTAYDQGSTYTLDYGSGPTSVNDSSSIRTSYGFGVTWNSPVGPVRVDWAEPSSFESFDRQESLSFSFGVGL